MHDELKSRGYRMDDELKSIVFDAPGFQFPDPINAGVYVDGFTARGVVSSRITSPNGFGEPAWCATIKLHGKRHRLWHTKNAHDAARFADAAFLYFAPWRTNVDFRSHRWNCSQTQAEFDLDNFSMLKSLLERLEQYLTRKGFIRSRKLLGTAEQADSIAELRMTVAALKTQVEDLDSLVGRIIDAGDRLEKRMDEIETRKPAVVVPQPEKIIYPPSLPIPDDNLPHDAPPPAWIADDIIKDKPGPVRVFESMPPGPPFPTSTEMIKTLFKL